MTLLMKELVGRTPGSPRVILATQFRAFLVAQNLDPMDCSREFFLTWLKTVNETLKMLQIVDDPLRYDPATCVQQDRIGIDTNLKMSSQVSVYEALNLFQILTR